MAKEVKTKARIAGCVILAAVLGMSYMCYKAAEFVTPAGGLVLFIALVWIGLVNVVRISVFPGSFFLCRMDLETRCCIEMVGMCLKALDDIEINAEANSYQDLNSVAYSTYFEAFNKIIQVKTVLEHLVAVNSANRANKRLLEMIIDLKKAAEHEKSEKTGNETEEIALECNEKQQILDAVKTLRKFLQDFSGLKGKTNYPTLLFSQKPLGDFNYMRSLILTTYKAEQIWVSAEDGCKIDCIFVKSELENADTVVLCNQNAAFYEYKFFPNEWTRFYRDQGLNLLIWNYRGYGRSQGRPDIKRLQVDSEIILRHFRSTYSLRKIAVHGESLGGSIACYLARKCEVDFLFADRTFASLSEACYFNFGRISYWGIRVFGKSDCDTVADYIGAKCYKLISCDPNDEMIHDLASLKSGVALRSVYPNNSLLTMAYLRPSLLASSSHILSPSETQKLATSLQSLYAEEKANVNFAEVINRLEEIDAGGKRLSDVLKDKQPALSLFLWILVLDLWGSSFLVNERFRMHMKVIQKISEVVEVIDGIEDEGVSEAVRCVKSSLIKIQGYFEEKCGIHGEIDDFSQAVKIVDSRIVGMLLAIDCGHCGSFSFLEKSAYTKHFQDFLDNSSN